MRRAAAALLAAFLLAALAPLRPAAADDAEANALFEAKCSICHDAQVEDFERGIHGSLHASGDADAPDCVACHGRHGIMESEIPTGAPEWLHDAVLASPTHRRNVPTLCSRCHQEGAQRHLPRKQISRH